MKLRQKLAAVMAAAMVVTSVPVVTMAASTNTLTRESVVVAEEHTFSDSTTAPTLKLKLNDYTGEKEVFYLKLENATWNKADESNLVDGEGTWKGEEGYTISNISDKELKVTVEADLDEVPVIKIPLLTQVKEGEATVEVVKMGSTSTVTTGKFMFATTNSEVATVSVDSTIPTLYTSGTIADINITEAITESFKNAGSNNTVVLTLQNSDFKFANTNFTVETSYGFNQELTAEDLNATINAQDPQVLTITLPSNLDADSLGRITLKGIEVQATTKTPETGDLTIDIDGKAVSSQSEVTVAKVVEYGSTIVAEDELVEIIAGRQDEVTFTLAETEKDSFVNNREVEFTLDKGFFVEEAETEAETIEALEKVLTIKNTVNKAELVITGVVVEDEKVVGFTTKMNSDSAKVDKIEVTAKISSGIEEEGDITVTASGRSLVEEVSGVIAKVKKAITVDTDAAVLKVGLQGQVAGSITITEAEKAMLKSGTNLTIEVPVNTGITVAKAPTVEVTSGDIQFGTATVSKVVDGKVTITVPVKRASRTASTFEIKDFTFTTDRTVAEGSFDVVMGGTAVSTIGETLTVEDFLVIGTPNTEDIVGANGLAKGTSTFVIGESKYTVNGVEKTMDAQSFIQNPGYTMVPVRYVAEAFGVGGQDILFSSGVVTIFAGNRTIQLTNGSDIAVVNGAQIKMGTKMVIKDGRTYAPVGEIARILGISTSWDNTTKTATFTNK